ncbi:MAG: hypothetical protein AAF402_13445, partial [Pseudomonadota bacterium]
MIVGILFVVFIAAVIWSIYYGRKIIRTEKTDAVFGNPSRALGGWHWVVAGVSSVLILWLWFSWDAARSYFPSAANELCQVAKVNRAVVPMRRAFPFDDNRLLQGTQLLARDGNQINLLRERLDSIGFNESDRSELSDILAEMDSVLAVQADPAIVEDTAVAKFREIAQRIDEVAANMASDDYSGDPDPEAQENAQAQPGWGRSHVEIPPLPETERGRKFDAASVTLEEIAKEFSATKNNGPLLTARLDALKNRIKSFQIDESGDESAVASRKEFVKQVDKIYKRIDDGKIFPQSVIQPVEQALVNLEDVKRDQQGALLWIDAIAMPGGDIQAGNNACSEQGSGRWLPKPSDTLRTFARMADPDVGYKGFPLLWYKMKPIAEMVGFLVPDWIADLIPGEYPRHANDGSISTNFKTKVYNFATGNFSSPSLP